MSDIYPEASPEDKKEDKKEEIIQHEQQETIITTITSTDDEALKLLQNVQTDHIMKMDYNQNVLESNFVNMVEFLKKMLSSQQVNSKEILQLREENQKLRDEQKDTQNDVSSLKQSVSELADLREKVRQLQEKTDRQENAHNILKADHLQSLDRIENNEKEIEELKGIVKKLSAKIRELEEQIAGLNDQINDLKQQLQLLKEQIRMLNDQLKELKADVDKIKLEQSLNQNNGEDGVDAGALQKLLEEMQKYLTKEEHNEKCQEYDNTIQQIQEDIEMLKKRPAGSEGGNGADQSEIDELREMIRKRVDNEKFEREINNLKKLIQQMSGSDGKDIQMVAGMGDDDKKLLEDCLSKFENLEEQVRRLRKDVDGNKNEYSRNKVTTDDRLTKLENEIKQRATNSDLKTLQELVEGMESTLSSTTELAKDNEQKIKQLKRSVNHLSDNTAENTGKGGDGITEELVDEKIRLCKEELLQLLKALKEEKVSFDDLWKSEAIILEKLDEVAGALLKKLADKSDTKKALIYLEKKINQLYMMLNKGGEGERNGDGLLVKRPLFWSCISCDKDLNKFQGRMGEYKNWAVFPPKETTPERMGRFGKGYKSLIERSKVREEKMRQESMQMQSQQSEGQLPTIHKTPGATQQNFNNNQEQQQEQQEN